MTKPFDSSHYSVESAKRRIREFERQVAVFVKTDPYAKVIDVDVSSGQDIHKVKLIKPMPRELPAIASEAVNHLRASLDQAGFYIATTAAVGKSGKKAHFPFGETLADVQSRIKGISKDLPKEIFDVMVACQPYKGGNRLLWAMNKICNSNKHEIVVPVAIYVGGGNTKYFKISLKEPANIRFPPTWDSIKNEMILWSVPHGQKLEYNLDIQTFIAIGDVEGVQGQPAIRVFNALADEVARILMALEAETRRLGYI